MTTTPSQPSFLFLLIDDVGWGDFSYNNGTALTPHIDEWARKTPGSIVLQDFHSGGTVCSPTRATVLTGRNHFRDCVDYVYGCSDMSTCVPNFEFAPSHTFTVGDAVRAAGGDYEAFFAGKWHLGSFFNDSQLYHGTTSSPISHGGFDHFNATVEVAPTGTLNCNCREEWRKDCDFGHYNTTNHCFPQDGPCCFNYWWDDPHSPHGVQNLTWPTPKDDSLYLVDSFQRFLTHRQAQAKPFLAQISFHNCHIPFIGMHEFKEACAKGEACRPPGPGEDPYSDEELDYYACLLSLDRSVGKILQSLKDAAYYENTMIWFGSDNGPENNCPPTGICSKGDTNPRRPKEGPGSAGILRGRKRDIYEGGHRVPSIVSFPAMVGQQGLSPIPADRSFESWQTVTTMDFLPTIMDLLKIDRPESQQSWAMDGRSIVPLLQNPNGFKWKDHRDGEREIGIGYFDPKLSEVNGWGFRYGKWKYVQGSASCKVDACRDAQLFDLEKDPGERHCLARKNPMMLAILEKKFEIWHASVMKSRDEESQCRKVHHELPFKNRGLIPNSPRTGPE